MPATGPSDYPTILIVGQDIESHRTLSATLRADGYLVLEARDRAAAVEFARTHSRSIHVLIDMSLNSKTWAKTVQVYRPKMQVLLIPQNETGDVLSPELVLEKVRQCLKASQNVTAKVRSAGSD